MAYMRNKYDNNNKIRAPARPARAPAASPPAAPQPAAPPPAAPLPAAHAAAPPHAAPPPAAPPRAGCGVVSLWLVGRGANVVFNLFCFKKKGFCTIEARILGQDRLTYCAVFSNLGVGVSKFAFVLVLHAVCVSHFMARFKYAAAPELPNP